VIAYVLLIGEEFHVVETVVGAMFENHLASNLRPYPISY
jgi:hypothetical protein